MIIISTTRTNWKINTFADFTILEVIIIKSLLRHHEPIVRHALYQEVNQIVNPENINKSITGPKDKLNAEALMLQSLAPKKELSTSSFYNSLNKLNTFGLVSFNLNNKGKVESLNATPLAKNALYLITGYFLQTIIDKESIESLIISKSLEIIGKSEFSTLLYISLKCPIEQNEIALYQKLTKDMSLLILEPQVDDISTKFKNVSFSTINKGLIREPDNFFEILIMPELQKDISIPEIPKKDFIKEMLRVTKNNGWIIMITQAEASKCDHLISDQILQLYNQSQNETGTVFSKSGLQKQLESIGLLDSKIIEYKGILIAIHTVKK